MARVMMACVTILCLMAIQSTETAETSWFHPAEPVGTVPEAYVETVRQDLLGNVPFIMGGLFTCDSSVNGKTVVRRIDTKGRTLAACEIDCGELQVSDVIGTSDGGFLIALGFVDRAVEKGVWLSDGGVVSRVVKCTEDGTVEWTRELPDVRKAMLAACFETGSGYVFFGEREDPERKHRGVYSSTDISCLTIGMTGDPVSLHTIGGSDFDMFERAERSDNGFTLYVRIQSQDGDFAAYAGHFRGGISLRIEVNEDFAVLGMEECDWQIGNADMIGTVDGRPVMRYSHEQTSLGLLSDPDAGTPMLVLDEGGYVLVVSENITGVYEDMPPFVSAIWYYYETVYSAYAKDGRLLWRAAIGRSRPESRMR